MALIKDNQRLPLSISIQDAKGNPAPVDGIPEWSVSDASLGALTVAPDGMSAEFAPAGPLGSCSIGVSCDADLGEGVRPILGSLDLQIVGGDAVVVQIIPGTPIDG